MSMHAMHAGIASGKLRVPASVRGSFPALPQRPPRLASASPLPRPAHSATYHGGRSLTAMVLSESASRSIAFLFFFLSFLSLSFLSLLSPYLLLLSFLFLLPSSLSASYFLPRRRRSFATLIPPSFLITTSHLALILIHLKPIPHLAPYAPFPLRPF